MSAEIALQAVSAVLFALGSAVLWQVWNEIRMLRKRVHIHAQHLVRHESGIAEARDKLELPPMPQVLEGDP